MILTRNQMKARKKRKAKTVPQKTKRIRKPAKSTRPGKKGTRRSANKKKKKMQKRVKKTTEKKSKKKEIIQKEENSKEETKTEGRMPTNSTNLEEPVASTGQLVMDQVSVEKSGPSDQKKSRYSFRKRIMRMKNDPSQFKEKWGVIDLEEDFRFYREEKRRDPHWYRRRRRSSGESFDGSSNNKSRRFSKKGNPRRRISKQMVDEIDSERDEEETERIANLHPCRFDMLLLQKLPWNYKDLKTMMKQIHCKVASLNKLWFYEQDEQMKNKKSDVDEKSVPVFADVQNFDWGKLRNDQLECGGRLFDVVMMDPPWQLSSSQPSRGVAIGYSSLSDDIISKIPIKTLQVEGFLFIWVINVKYGLALKLFEKWGYQLIDEVVWIKRTVTGKLAKGHGFYLQHSKETCLVGFKGDISRFLPGRKISKRKGKNGVARPGFGGIAQDVIFSERRGQSQKPNEIYDIIERLVPQGFYLEIFGRRNNLKSNWVTIGNEL